MSDKLTDAEIKHLRGLVDEVVDASSKAAAKEPTRRLEFAESEIRGRVSGAMATKFGEVVSYAKQASGKPRDKEHWQSAWRASWSVFVSGVK